MTLLIKCVVASLIMVGIHFLSKTPNYYLSGLLLSFPGLSIVAYYFMYQEYGADKVRTTSAFAMCSVIPFALFLLSLNLLLKKHGIRVSLLCAGVIWVGLALTLAVIWKKIH